jgi:DNA-binding FadR family transcriptional regulator
MSASGGFSLSPLTPPANLTAELVRRLSAEIRSGRLRPGQRLPTEQALMRQAGVSRTVVREAVAALRAEGLVVTRQGVGAFVAERPGEGLFRLEPLDADEANGLAQALQVLELRLALEVEAAGLAAGRRDPTALAAIQAAQDAFGIATGTGELGVEADFAFHRAVSAATANPYFTRMLDFLGRVIIPRQSVRLAERTEAERIAYLRRVQEEHLRVTAAIAAGDPAAARREMRRHLEAARDRYRRMAAATAAGSLRGEEPPP